MKIQNTETVLVMRNKISNRLKKIDSLKEEIKNLERKIMTTSNKDQQYKEAQEDVLISGRPKKYESKLLGKLHWKQYFIDEDTGEKVEIDRATLVKVNGEFVI